MPQIQQNQQVPEIFQRHIGTWKGEYIKTDIKGQFISSFFGSFTIEIEGKVYRQVNRYRYPDGKQVELHFSGEMEYLLLKNTELMTIHQNVILRLAVIFLPLLACASHDQTHPLRPPSL